MRCAQIAGACTEAVQQYVAAQMLQTALTRAESLCILGFPQHAVTLGRKGGVAVSGMPLNCLPCTLFFLCGWAFVWAVTATREAAASVFSCVFLPPELVVLFWCVFNRPSPERQCRPILTRRICFPPASSQSVSVREQNAVPGWRDAGTSRCLECFLGWSVQRLRFWAQRPCLPWKPGRQSPPLLPLEQNQWMTNTLFVNTSYPISD